MIGVQFTPLSLSWGAVVSAAAIAHYFYNLFVHSKIEISSYLNCAFNKVIIIFELLYIFIFIRTKTVILILQLKIVYGTIKGLY